MAMGYFMSASDQAGLAEQFVDKSAAQIAAGIGRADPLRRGIHIMHTY